MRANRRAGHQVRRGAPGSSPGTISVDPQALPTTLQIIAYGPEALVEEDLGAVSDLDRLSSDFSVVWVNVTGLGSRDVLVDLAERFDLHLLVMEDVVNVGQRPKIEEYDAGHFVVLRMPRSTSGPETEQLGIFLGNGFVITFQERPGDCLDPVRRRIREGRARIRGSGPDYLTYSIMDAVVDGYFPLIETYSDRVTAVEGRLLTEAGHVTIAELYDLRQELVMLRNTMRSIRDAVASLVRTDPEQIAKGTFVFLRDCYDHSIQGADLAETLVETSSSLIELYRSNIQGKLNEVMKVLTVTATVFIPLSFIAGLFGMNFDPEASPLNMPELGWYWGYPFALTLMAAVAMVMLFYFRRKGWVGRPPEAPSSRDDKS